MQSGSDIEKHSVHLWILLALLIFESWDMASKLCLIMFGIKQQNRQRLWFFYFVGGFVLCFKRGTHLSNVSSTQCGSITKFLSPINQVEPIGLHYYYKKEVAALSIENRIFVSLSNDLCANMCGPIWKPLT